jgi:hypothetical protein
MTDFLRYGHWYNARGPWTQTPWNKVLITPFGKAPEFNYSWWPDYQEGQDYVRGNDFVIFRGYNTVTNRDNASGGGIGDAGFLIGENWSGGSPLRLDEKIYFVPFKRNEDQYLFTPQ